MTSYRTVHTEEISKNRKRANQLRRVALCIHQCDNSPGRMQAHEKSSLRAIKNLLDCGLNPVILHQEWPNKKEGQNNEQEIYPPPPGTLCAGR
jgi:hypothetical protein